jgi:hypothetical protein
MKKMFLILPVVALMAVSCGGQQASTNTPAAQSSTAQQQADGTAPTPTPDQTQTAPGAFNTIKINLTGQNNSGQSGTATIFDVNGKANVILTMSGLPANAQEPAHVHFGSCKPLGGVEYPLSTVATGTSQTILPVSLAALASQAFAINVHKSAAEIGVYVACGDSTNMVKSISTNH